MATIEGAGGREQQQQETTPVVRDPRVPKFPVIFPAPTFQQIVDNVGTNDYVQWAVLGSASFPLGYMVGMQLDRKLARPAMLFTGIMGCIGGAMLSYQNSELRLQGFGRNDDEVARYLAPAQADASDKQ